MDNRKHPSLVINSFNVLILILIISLYFIIAEDDKDIEFTESYEDYGVVTTVQFHSTTPEVNITGYPEFSLIKLKKYNRYIFASYITCSGLGNQMYRISALYGIGLHLNRTPGFDANKKCQRKYTNEYLMTFPNVMKLIGFHDLNNSEVTHSDFGSHCCKYDDPEMQVTSVTILRSYKYFHSVKDHIRELFDFHPKIKDTVEAYGKKLFTVDSDSHKMCIHIRRGDFIRYGMLETRADFLLPAMTTVRDFVSKKYSGKKISLIFFTTDWKFVNSLNFTKSDYFKIYHPELSNRAENMYFGIRFCDSILLSASGSTFGFWIAYLMPERSPVFYNGQIENVRGGGKYLLDYIDYDKFPKDWNMLELNRKTNTVTIDNRWFFEKFGLRTVNDVNAIHI